MLDKYYGDTVVLEKAGGAKSKVPRASKPPGQKQLLVGIAHVQAHACKWPVKDSRQDLAVLFSRFSRILQKRGCGSFGIKCW